MVYTTDFTLLNVSIYRIFRESGVNYITLWYIKVTGLLCKIKKKQGNHMYLPLFTVCATSAILWVAKHLPPYINSLSRAWKWRESWSVINYTVPVFTFAEVIWAAQTSVNVKTCPPDNTDNLIFRTSPSGPPLTQQIQWFPWLHTRDPTALSHTPAYK